MQAVCINVSVLTINCLYASSELCASSIHIPHACYTMWCTHDCVYMMSYTVDNGHPFSQYSYIHWVHRRSVLPVSAFFCSWLFVVATNIFFLPKHFYIGRIFKTGECSWSIFTLMTTQTCLFSPILARKKAPKCCSTLSKCDTFNRRAEHFFNIFL